MNKIEKNNIPINKNDSVCVRSINEYLREIVSDNAWNYKQVVNIITDRNIENSLRNKTVVDRLITGHHSNPYLDDEGIDLSEVVIKTLEINGKTVDLWKGAILIGERNVFENFRNTIKKLQKKYREKQLLVNCLKFYGMDDKIFHQIDALSEDIISRAEGVNFLKVN